MATKVKATANEDIKPIKHKEFLRYNFTEDELKKKGQDLAQANQELQSLENEKKSVMSTYKSKMDGKEALISTLANNIQTGFEHRSIDCLTEFNKPSLGMKRTTRMDTAEVINTVQMTADEMQLKLDVAGNNEDEED